MSTTTTAAAQRHRLVSFPAAVAAFSTPAPTVWAPPRRRSAAEAAASVSLVRRPCHRPRSAAACRWRHASPSVVGWGVVAHPRMGSGPPRRPVEEGEAPEVEGGLLPAATSKSAAAAAAAAAASAAAGMSGNGEDATKPLVGVPSGSDADLERDGGGGVVPPGSASTSGSEVQVATPGGGDDGINGAPTRSPLKPTAKQGWLAAAAERALGTSLTPELTAILCVYFVQGALGISRLALSFFLKDDLGLSPAAVSALTGILVFPWLIKPLYGFLSDSVPLFGYRRRSYLAGAGVLGAVAWTALATWASTPTQAIVAATLGSASVAISDVVADSLVVERSRGASAETAGGLQSLMWGASATGGLLSAYFSGSLLTILTARQVFGLTALFPVATASLSLLIPESPMARRAVHGRLTSTVAVFRARAARLWGALSQRQVYLPAAFVFLWQATPSPDAALFFFQTSELGFGPEFLGRVRLVSSAASLVGVFVFRRFLRSVPTKQVMLWATIVGLPLSLTQLALVTRLNVSLGIPDRLFALTDTAVLTVLGQVSFMPTLVLAARLCPPDVEASLFAALMSVYNASGVVSNESGAALTAALGVSEGHYDNLALLVGMCCFLGVLPLPLLGWLDEAPANGGHEAAGEGKKAEEKV